MTARHLLLVAVALLCACGTETEPPETSPLTEAQAAHLEAMVGSFVTSQGYPNIAIGVVMGSDLVWHAGFGKGAKLGTKPDADSIFRVGSVTKLVTSTALLALAEDGALSLEDEAAVWLPEAEAVLSPQGSPPITLRHLISHSSGLPRDSEVLYMPGDNFTEAEVLAALDGVTLLYSPGTNHMYSNLGASLAGIVISRASGKSFRSFVQERVFNPLAMQNSVWDEPRSGLAPGHYISSRGDYDLSGAQLRLGALEPQGGLFTTVRDLASLASHGLGHASILSSGTLAESQTEQRRIPGDFGYGLGWLVSEMPGGGKLAWHDGSSGDYGAYVGVLPDQGVGVAIAMGTGEAGDVEEIRSLGAAILAYLVDPETDVVPEESTTPPAATEAVGERLLRLIADPTPALIRESFAPSFLRAISEDELISIFKGVSTGAGACSKWSTLEDRGFGSFVLRIGCARDTFSAVVWAEYYAPYQIQGLFLTE